VKHSVGIRVLTAVVSSVALSQTAAVPAEWIGTWKLSLQESKFGLVWGPGVPDGLTVASQTLKIAAAAGRLRVAGDTVTSELGSLHEESDVNLDGKEAVLPPGLTISFRRIDDTAFDVILKVNNKDIGNHVGENRFVFSPDGKRLTETKTHTERAIVPEGADQTKSAVIKTSTTVLVFYKVFDAK
jgi:hypothetical protein